MNDGILTVPVMGYKALKTVLIYLVFATVWIFFFSKAVTRVFDVDEFLMNSLFVLVSSVFLYFLVRKQHQALLRSEFQYRHLFESNPYPMWIYRIEDFSFMEVNDAAVNIYGFSREEFLRMTILDIRPSEDRGKVIEEVKKYERKPASSSSGIWRHLKKSGEEFVASVKAFPVTFNNHDCAMVLAVDVTERITQQKQLELAYEKEIELNNALASHIELIRKSHEENRRMVEIIDKINNFVIITGKDGKLRWVNKAFCQFTGYSLQDIAGKDHLQLLGGLRTNEQTIRSLLEAVSKQEFFSAEIINYTKDRQEYWVQMDVSPIYDKEGNLDCFISVESLITERKAREERIRSQNSTLRELAWMNSHEIRRPITSILGLIDIIKNVEDVNEKEECFRMLEVCSKDLDAVVKDIAKRVNIAEDDELNRGSGSVSSFL